MQGKKEQQKELLSIGELAKKIEVRQSTLKYYSSVKIIPLKQVAKRMRNYYNPEEVLKSLKEIQKLKDKGKNMKEIIKQIKSK